MKTRYILIKRINVGGLSEGRGGKSSFHLIHASINGINLDKKVVRSSDIGTKHYRWQSGIIKHSGNTRSVQFNSMQRKKLK